MTKLFRIRGNGVILFDRFWFYGFRRSWPFCTLAARSGDWWMIVNPSKAIDYDRERDGEPVTRWLVR